MGQGDGGGDAAGFRSRQDTLLITFYLSDASIHQVVEAAVEKLVQSAGLHIAHRDDAVLGSWFRRMWAAGGSAMRSPTSRDAVATLAHAADTRLVLSQDATVTATLLQNLGPVLTALQPTHKGVVRASALLIVKLDDGLIVHQLTPNSNLSWITRRNSTLCRTRSFAPSEFRTPTDHRALGGTV
jgi:hypothetical protein